MTNAIDSKSVSESHVIQVPEELVGGWISEIWHDGTPIHPSVQVAASDLLLVNKAAQWGYDQREPELQERADQELEACCDCILDAYSDSAVTGDARLIDKRILVQRLRAARRPKPPTLADQGLKALGPLVSSTDFRTLTFAEQATIRTALNRLKRLEAEMADHPIQIPPRTAF
jgi:hypothetical protein